MNTKNSAPKKPHLVFVLLTGFFCGALLTGCGDKVEDSASDNLSKGSSAQSENKTESNPLQQQPQQQSGQAQAPAPLQPQVVAPPPIFQPSLDDVRFAFTNAFLATYGKLPKTPTNESWALGEQRKIVAMKVQSCSTSTVGTASVCRVIFNNSQADVKLMLTRSGWALTP